MSKTNTIRKRKLKKRVDVSKYANIETGETFDSELNRAESTYIEVETGEVVLTFADFVSYDTSFEEEICRRLPDADYKRYRLMSCWLHTNFNVVLSGNNRPHTLETLSKAIGLSKDGTTRLVSRLTKEGLMLHGIFPESGYDKKIYIMNPFVTRKRKTFHEHMLTLFTDIRYAKPQAKTSNKTATKKAAQLLPEQAN